VLLLVLGHDKPDTFIRARTRDSFAQRVVSHDLLLARPYQAAIVCSTQHARPSADVLQLEPPPTHPALALKRTSAPRQEQQHHHHLWMLIGKLQLLHHKPHTHCTRDAAMTSSTYKDAYCAVVLVERRERGMCTLMCTLCPFSSRHLHYSSSTTAPPLQLLHYSSSTTAPPPQLLHYSSSLEEAASASFLFLFFFLLFLGGGGGGGSGASYRSAQVSGHASFM